MASIEKLSSVIQDIPGLVRPLVSQRAQWKIHNATAQLVNAIRRVVLTETKIKRFKLVSIKTDDPFINCNINYNEIISQIPIRQDVALGGTYIIDVENSSDKGGDTFTLPVRTTDIKQKTESGNMSLDSVNNIIMWNLQPKKSITVEMTVVEEEGRDDAIFNGAITASSYQEEKTGDFILLVETNGDITPEELVKRAIVSIISRLKNMDSNLSVYRTKTDSGNFEYQISGESATTVYLIAKEIFMENPDIPFIAPFTEQNKRAFIKIKAASEEAADNIISKAIHKCIEDMEGLSIE